MKGEKTARVDAGEKKKKAHGWGDDLRRDEKLVKVKERTEQLLTCNLPRFGLQALRKALRDTGEIPARYLPVLPVLRLP